MNIFVRCKPRGDDNMVIFQLKFCQFKTVHINTHNSRVTFTQLKHKKSYVLETDSIYPLYSVSTCCAGCVWSTQTVSHLCMVALEVLTISDNI